MNSSWSTCLHERPRRICEPLRIRLTSLRLIRLTPRVFSALNFELLRNLSLGSMSTFLGDLTGMLAGSGRGWTDDLLSRCPPSPRRCPRPKAAYGRAGGSYLSSAVCHKTQEEDRKQELQDTCVERVTQISKHAQGSHSFHIGRRPRRPPNVRYFVCSRACD